MSRHPHYEIIKALIEDTSLEVEGLCLKGDYGEKYWIDRFGGSGRGFSDITYWAEIPALPEEENK